MAGRDLIVVTGGSSGIGLALARRLRRPDADLLLVARGPERLADAAAALGCATLAADLATEAGTAALAERLAGVDRIPVLVNNAGGPFRTPLLEHDPHEAAAAVTRTMAR